MRNARLGAISAIAVAALALGCSAAAPARPHTVVAPAPPPKDDGTAAQGGEGGLEHAAALEQLKVGGLGWRIDRQNSVRVELPDPDHWLRVKFWGLKSLVGFRYGKDHHAIVAGFVIHVDDETAPGVCSTTFERWAQPWVDSFEVTIEHDPPKAVSWNGKIADIDSLVATTATLGDRDRYAVAYGIYPAWKGACLVLGVAVPARDELERAKLVRDRFAAGVLPNVQVVTTEEPKERY
ncbi:MAG TPA: hypothetical protein VN894_05305 [Polyangiaceae bacterium]|nr:hypothetical protein [Polyangiaceae bacterium]